MKLRCSRVYSSGGALSGSFGDECDPRRYTQIIVPLILASLNLSQYLETCFDMSLTARGYSSCNCGISDQGDGPDIPSLNKSEIRLCIYVASYMCN